MGSNNFDGAIIIESPISGQGSGTGRFGFGSAQGASYILGYDTGTVSFAVGEVVTGAGGAVGTVVAINNSSGASPSTKGYLYLKSVTGTFVDNEALTVAGAPRAACNGVLIFYENGDSTHAAWGFDSVIPTLFKPPGSIMSRTDTGKLYVSAGVVNGVVTWNLVTSA